jgi:hypothetical protein
MPTVKGKAAALSFMASIPGEMKKVLRGAARAGADIVIDEAKVGTRSQEVADALTKRTEGDDTRVVVKISVKKGWPRSVAIWEEYGTARHVISVKDGASEGMSVNRINRLAKEGSLVIGGKWAGASVIHPGTEPHPFLRPALDKKEGEAKAAAQSYINARVRPSGIVASSEPEGDEA